MITDFGKELRKYRIDMTITLRDMAKSIAVSAAYLSAVESGKKNITDTLFDNVVKFFELDFNETEKLRNIADLSQKKLSISLTSINDEQRDSAVMFARRLNSLNQEDLEKINQILEES